jgi:23S rRNA (guanine745-N1)-methyltransferase
MAATVPRVWPPRAPPCRRGAGRRPALPVRAAASTSTSDDPPFLCPVCAGPLHAGPSTSTPTTTRPRHPPLLCPAGHAHDRAKDGHVFLLPTGRKKREASGPPGDAEAQVRARRAFFDGGHYDRVTASAADAVVAVLKNADDGDGGDDAKPGRRAVLDAGCGEGAYVGALAAALDGRPGTATPTVSLLGVDVSKPAIRLASARHGRRARFAVASSFALPVGGASLDALLVAMAPPPPPAELARVLKRGGALVIVRPAPRHLDGLKRAVYGGAARFDGEEEEGGGSGPGPSLPLLHRTRLTYDLALPAPAAAALLGMTPFAWSAGRGGVAEAWAREAEEGGEGVALETAVDVWVETWGRPA